jgi:hypothetical protein
VPCGANINSYTSSAASGSTLTLGACSYPNQNFTSTTPVTVQGQGALTMVGDMDAHGAQNITFRNFNATDLFWVPQNGSGGGRLSSNLTTDGVNFTAGGIFLRGCQNCTFRNGGSGNRHDSYSQTIGAYSSADPSRNITIQNWLFHDMDRQANPAGHVECLFIQESVGVLLDNVHFTRCEVFDLYISDLYGGPISGITVRNSRFDEVIYSGYYAVDQNFATNSTWINNSFGQGLRVALGSVNGCGNLTDSPSFTFPATLRPPC